MEHGLSEKRKIPTDHYQVEQKYLWDVLTNHAPQLCKTIQSAHIETDNRKPIKENVIPKVLSCQGVT